MCKCVIYDAVNFCAGLYAIEVVGDLPDDVKENCESHGWEYRAAVKASK